MLLSRTLTLLVHFTPTLKTGIDWDAPDATDYDRTSVVEIPDTRMPLNETSYHELVQRINPE